MITGQITCTCGQLFGFSTEFDTIACPTCKITYISADHGVEEVVEEVPLPEEPSIENPIE